MDAYRKSALSVLEALGVSGGAGHNTRGVLAAREKYGANELSRAKKKNPILKILAALAEPMMIILLVAFGITLTVNLIKVSRGESFDWAECAGIFAAIVISVTITFLIERRGEKAFDALHKIGGNVSAKVMRAGSLQQVPAAELVVGDILKLTVGDKIPVDARLIKTDDFETDESPLTGESSPVLKNAAAVFSGPARPPLAERVNMVYGGCFVTAGSALAVVTAVGDRTELGAIARALKTHDPAPTPLQQKLTKLGKLIAVFGAAAAVIVFIAQTVMLAAAGELSFGSAQDVFITGIVLIVAAVPEGLPTIVAVSLALNVIKMAKESALVKTPAACETIGGIGVICSDKTGTLTENKMTVHLFRTAAGETPPESLRDENLFKNFCINSTADISYNADAKRYDFIGNPTECATLTAYNAAKPARTYQEMRAAAKIAHVYPFSSELKRMTTVFEEGGRLTALCKGAPEIVLSLCAVDARKKAAILSEIAAHQNNAKRVIAFAHGAAQACDFRRARGKIERNLIFDGYAVLSDPIRPDVYAAVAAAKKAGIAVKMLTGDHAATARAIARELNIAGNDAGVFGANEIEKMSDDELKRALPGIKVVARSTPATKLRIVKALRETGEIVAVTGDGINDAPAVKAADVGIAMGRAGTEVCKEAAGIVVLDDSFATIVNAIRWGRGLYENFQRFIMFQLTVNISAVLVTVVCILSGVGAPFNALALLWINIIMDGPPALTLGLEPIYDGLMDKRPVRRGSSIVTKTMALRITVNALFIAAILLLQAFTNFLGFSTAKERTALFTLFILFQLFNTFNARELGRESILRTFARNKLMLIAMAVTFVLQIVIVQFGGGAFATVPLSLTEWLKIFLLALSVIVFNEVYKLVYKKVSLKKKRRRRKRCGARQGNVKCRM